MRVIVGERAVVGKDLVPFPVHPLRPRRVAEKLRRRSGKTAADRGARRQRRLRAGGNMQRYGLGIMVVWWAAWGWRSQWSSRN